MSCLAQNQKLEDMQMKKIIVAAFVLLVLAPFSYAQEIPAA
jgi:hypothetical protein